MRLALAMAALLLAVAVVHRPAGAQPNPRARSQTHSESKRGPSSKPQATANSASNPEPEGSEPPNANPPRKAGESPSANSESGGAGDSPSLELEGSAPAVLEPKSRETDLMGSGGTSLDADVRDLGEQNLEDLLQMKVVSATGAEQETQQAPSIITVVTREQINAWGYRSVAELLKRLSGFYVIDDHTIPNVGIRGIAGGLRSQSGLIKVMIDGHSVAFRSTAGNWLGPELLPIAAIERVEIIKGPVSAVYGADAFMGVINIITRNAADVDGGELRFGANRVVGNQGGGGEFLLGTRSGDLSVFAAGRLHTEDRSGLTLPETSPAPTLPTYARDRKADRLRSTSGSAFARATYHIDERTALQLSGYVSILNRGGEFSDWLQLGAGLDSQGRQNENRISLAQAYTDLHLTMGLSESFELDVDAMAFVGQPTQADRLEVGSDLFYVERDLGFRGVETQLRARWNPLQTLTFVLGAGMIADEEQRLSVLNVLKRSIGETPAGSIRESTSVRQDTIWLLNPGAHLQAIWEAWGQLLTVTGGFRYDYHNIYGNQLSGRAGITSTPTEGLSLKVLYGNAFKAPPPLLLWAQPFRPGGVVGNEELDAQRVHSVEAQAIYDGIDWLILEAGVVYSILLNRATFIPQGINLAARNVAQLNSLAVEGTARVHWSRLHAYLNGTWQDTQRQLGTEGYRARLVNGQAPLFPGIMVNAGIRYSMPQWYLRASLEGTYIGERIASDFNALERGERYRLPSYFLLDATVASTDLGLFDEPGRKTTLSLVARNILDERGPDPGFGGVDYPLPPRRLGLEFRQTF